MLARPRSTPIPATIGTLFGGLWAFIAAMSLPPDWRATITVLVATATVAFIARLWWTRAPATEPRGTFFKRRAYQISVLAEVVAIYIASGLLPRYGLQSYFIQTVGIIVGLHFIGLWFAAQSFRFLGIAAGMIIISAIAILLPASLHSIDFRNLVTGAGNALVLWLGAAWSTLNDDRATSS